MVFLHVVAPVGLSFKTQLDFVQIIFNEEGIIVQQRMYVPVIFKSRSDQGRSCSPR